ASGIPLCSLWSRVVSRGNSFVRVAIQFFGSAATAQSTPGDVPIGWSTDYVRSLTQKRVLLWGADQAAAIVDAQAAYKRCARLLLVCSSHDAMEDVIAQVTSEEPIA
ncbi:unnamed protein product, partial [Symbiodinium sp. KB8]